MSHSTASNRLIKDIIFNFIKDKPCCKCGESMSRQDFSIEHIVPWLDSEDPVKLFFDLENISYSHIKCNIGSARKTKLTAEQQEAKRKEKNDRRRNSYRETYTTEKRRERYLKNKLKAQTINK